MALQLVAIGSAVNDGTGDPLRTAFDKLNDNDSELYDIVSGVQDFDYTTAPASSNTAFGFTFSGGNITGIDNFELASFKGADGKGLVINTEYPDYFSSTAIQFDASSMNNAFGGIGFVTQGLFGIVSFRSPGVSDYVGFNPGTNSVISSNASQIIVGVNGGASSVLTCKISEVLGASSSTTLGSLASPWASGYFDDTNGVGILWTNGSTVDVGIRYNTDGIIIVDASEKLGFFGTTPVAQPSANADTSGATLGQLETEVNELKQLLRDVGLMAA